MGLTRALSEVFYSNSTQKTVGNAVGVSLALNVWFGWMAMVMSVKQILFILNIVPSLGRALRHLHLCISRI